MITLDNLSAALADRVDWVAVIRVTEQAIQVWRRLAAETPADELVLARSLASLARAYERTENPAAAALAAATEAIGIYQRLAAASPETTEPLLRDAAQVRDDLLLARDRQLLPPERSGSTSRPIVTWRLLKAGTAGGRPAADGYSGYRRNRDRHRAFAEPHRRGRGHRPGLPGAPDEHMRRNPPEDTLGRPEDAAVRCLELYLSTRRNTGICRRHLRYPDPSPDDQESPPAAPEGPERVSNRRQTRRKRSRFLSASSPAC